MARTGLFGLSLPSNQIRDLRSPSNPFHSWMWGRGWADSADGGRQGICSRRPPQGMPVWHLSRDQCGTCCKGPFEWVYHIFSLHCLAGEGGGYEAEICGEPLQAIEELEEGNRKNGKYFGVCNEHTRRRPLYIHGHSARLSSSSFTSDDARLVHLQVRRSVLSMRCAAIWLGKVPLMVYTTHGDICNRATETWISSFRLSGRFPHMPVSVRKSSHYRTLFYSAESHFWPPTSHRTGTTPRQGRVGRRYHRRAPRSHRRLSANEVLRRSSKDLQGAKTGISTAQGSFDRTALGQSQGTEVILRCMCITNARNAMGTLLHKVAILGHVSYYFYGWTRQVSFKSPRHSRFASVEKTGRKRIDWPPLCTLSGRSIDAHGCSGRRIRGILHMADMRPGLPGQLQSQGIWSWRDRASSITLRELRAVRRLLVGKLGQHVVDQYKSDLLLHVDNQAVVHIVNRFVSASRPMMRELRRLKSVLDRFGFSIRAEWIPSAANKFADALSRRFPRGDLRVRKKLRRSVLAGMQARDVFKYRPLGEHPVFLRRQAYKELDETWDQTEVRLLCPPVDLIGATVRKLTMTRAPEILLIPDWRRQAWHQAAVRITSKVIRLPNPPEEVWEAQQTFNPAWRLLLLEVNLE